MAFSIEETRDFQLIRSIIAHPAVYPVAACDDSPPAEEFRPCEMDGIRYLLVRLDGRPSGIWMFVPHSATLYEVHTALLPPVRGKEAVKAAEAAKTWLWSNTRCRRLITSVPNYNKAAAIFSTMAGMKLYGVNEKAFMKNGKLCDILMFGICKPEVS